MDSNLEPVSINPSRVERNNWELRLVEDEIVSSDALLDVDHEYADGGEHWVHIDLDDVEHWEINFHGQRSISAVFEVHLDL